MSLLSRISIAFLILIPALALALPILAFDDKLPAGSSHEEARRLKTQAALGTKLWPLFKLQVSQIRSTGPTPDEVEGVVIWRSAFGVPVGRTTYANDASHLDLSLARTLLLWSGTFALETAMLALAVWSFNKEPEPSF